jgi:hemerythrin-like domain-containing protein
MDEHTALVDHAYDVRRDLARGDLASAMSRLAHLVAHLDRHVGREEDGIFRAMRGTGEFVDEVDELEAEHREFAATIAALDPGATGFAAAVTQLLDDLDEHVEREDLGIFPVSVVTLGATGWAIVDRAHTRSPSFLLDAATSTATT